jgi:hypothetical protein
VIALRPIGTRATSPATVARRDAGVVEIVLVLVVVLVLAVVQVRRRGSRLQRAEELRRSKDLPPRVPPR